MDLTEDGSMYWIGTRLFVKRPFTTFVSLSGRSERIVEHIRAEMADFEILAEWPVTHRPLHDLQEKELYTVTDTIREEARYGKLDKDMELCWDKNEADHAFRNVVQVHWKILNRENYSEENQCVDQEPMDGMIGERDGTMVWIGLKALPRGWELAEMGSVEGHRVEFDVLKSRN